jgi:endonuclease III
MLLPMLVELCKAVEQLIPQSGQGAAKLAAVLKLVEGLMGDISNVRPELEAIIGVIVKTANAIGLFHKTA